MAELPRATDISWAEELMLAAHNHTVTADDQLFVDAAWLVAKAMVGSSAMELILVSASPELLTERPTLIADQ